MKKLSGLALLILFILASSACGKCSSDSFVVTLDNKSEADISCIHIEYYLGDDTVGGGLMGDGDMTNISYGDNVSYKFIKADFPAGADLSTFKVIFYAVNKSRSETRIGEPVTINAEYNNNYSYVLTGDYESGFSVNVQ